MIALRFVRLIESHSDLLAEGVLLKLRSSARSADLLDRVPEAELRDRVYEIYRNLSEWLLNKTDADIRRVYLELGRRRAEQGVTISSLCWSIMMTRENLWDFLQNQGLRETPMQLLGELELLRLLDQFYDRATYYTALGHESYVRETQTLRIGELRRSARADA